MFKIKFLDRMGLQNKKDVVYCMCKTKNVFVGPTFWFIDKFICKINQSYVRQHK